MNEQRIEKIKKLQLNGNSIKEIAQILEVSESTIYRDLRQYKLSNQHYIDNIIEKINKINLKESLEALSYSDISLLCKKFNCGYWIRKKSKRIEKLYCFFSQFFYFGLKPNKINRFNVKSAYYKKAKELHPDSTKTNSNKDFIEMSRFYDALIKTIQNSIGITV